MNAREHLITLYIWEIGDKEAKETQQDVEI